MDEFVLAAEGHDFDSFEGLGEEGFLKVYVTTLVRLRALVTGRTHDSECAESSRGNEEERRNWTEWTI